MKKRDYSEKLQDSVLNLRVFSQNFGKAKKEDIPQNALNIFSLKLEKYPYYDLQLNSRIET